MIEESDRNETKNQARASPEPDVLMKHVENDHSKNKQEISHGGENLTSLSNQCQGIQTHTSHKSKFALVLLCVFLDMTNLSETWPVARERDDNQCYVA